MARNDIVAALIDAQGTLYSEEMGARIERDTPQELFHWLIGTIMLSARIGAAQAVQGASALRREGLHKIDAIRAVDRTRLVRVLNENGYARYDESTADYIRAAADLVFERYAGDLRRMREGDANAVRQAVQEVKGIGPAGAGIFAREMQMVWDELHPSAEGPALDAAGDLGLPQDPGELADLAGSPERMVRLVAGLTRAALDGPAEAVRRAA